MHHHIEWISYRRRSQLRNPRPLTSLFFSREIWNGSFNFLVKSVLCMLSKKPSMLGKAFLIILYVYLSVPGICQNIFWTNDLCYGLWTYYSFESFGKSYLGKKSWYLFKRRKLSVSILANIRLQSQTQDQHFWIMKRIRKNPSRVCCLNTLTHTCYIKYIGKTESSISHVQYKDILLSCVANV